MFHCYSIKSRKKKKKYRYNHAYFETCFRNFFGLIRLQYKVHIYKDELQHNQYFLIKTLSIIQHEYFQTHYR